MLRTTALFAFFAGSQILGQEHALRFDGVDDFVRLTDAAEVNHLPAYTIEVWVRVQAGHGYGVVYAESTFCGPSMHITVHADGSVRFSRKTDVFGPFMWVSSAAGSLPLDTWTHVSAKCDLSIGSSLYLNGQLVAHNNDRRTYTTAGHIDKTSIGSSWAGCNGGHGYTEFFRGDVADLRLWASARTTQEIQANMGPGSVTGAEPGLRAFWPLDEVGQQTIRDATSMRMAYLGLATTADLNDPVWVSMGSIQGMIWRLIPSGVAALPARHDHAAAWDHGRNRLVVFGGIGAQTLGDTWEWDGSRWQPRLTAVFPSARQGHCAAYDSDRQRVVIYGGRSAAGQVLGDTWEWSGSTWTQVFSVTSPGPREHYSMTYDPIRQCTVLFGGSDSGNRQGSTWTWNGTDWLLRSATGPSARFGHAATFDSRRERVVLFGGYDGSNQNDTWEWDGASWTVVQHATRPPARGYHRIEYDPMRRQAVLFGGTDANIHRNDTWILDDSGWRATSSVFAPSARCHHTLTYDPVGQQMLVFGGIDSTSRSDLWRSAYIASQFAFGTGCGQPALTLGPGASPPVVGQVFTAPLTNLPAGTPIAWMSLGLRADMMGPFVLPMPLDGFGMPGCLVYHDISLALMLACTTTGPGTAQFSMPVPNVLSLGGLRTYAQAWVAEPTVNAGGVVTSNALLVVFGTP